MTDRPVLLKNPIQHYAWGSKTEIQQLLGGQPDSQSPWAELWMGAHPKSPSQVLVNNGRTNLDEWIRANPEAVLGSAAARAYENTLPYLFKVLAAEQPLSIQAHPDQTRALEGFARENRRGIPIDAPNRNYRDPWPKPELICALKPFGALLGFRDPGAIVEGLRHFCPRSLAQEIAALAERPEARGIERFFHSLMTLGQTRSQQVIEEALDQDGGSGRPEAAWICRLHDFYPGDIGVLAPVFLNLVEINPGSAVFLPPGMLHAYLYGLGIEIMANSDNVLRGGLTQKYVDVDELMHVLEFSPFSVHQLQPEPVRAHEKQYPCPAREFTLSEITIRAGEVYHSSEAHSAEILLCLAGSADIETPAHQYRISIVQGQSALVPAAAGPWQVTGDARIYKAGVRP
ncbi:MAG: mannose-6-phosphate isomerase, class I [Desulfobacteraceae bacterium]|nr:mannose-6-phosphate isomerase, class I [Desulfobacteraceae bacterium]